MWTFIPIGNSLKKTLGRLQKAVFHSLMPLKSSGILHRRNQVLRFYLAILCSFWHQILSQKVKSLPSFQNLDKFSRYLAVPSYSLLVSDTPETLFCKEYSSSEVEVFGSHFHGVHISDSQVKIDRFEPLVHLVHKHRFAFRAYPSVQVVTLVIAHLQEE
jgi:hypothetical protein